MQRNTLEKVFHSLVRMEHEVTVDPQVARRAIVPIHRMLEITAGASSQWPGWQEWDLPVSFSDDWVLAAANDLR